MSERVVTVEQLIDVLREWSAGTGITRVRLERSPDPETVFIVRLLKEVPQ
jgi:hypothetical protein